MSNVELGILAVLGVAVLAMGYRLFLAKPATQARPAEPTQQLAVYQPPDLFLYGFQEGSKRASAEVINRVSEGFKNQHLGFLQLGAPKPPEPPKP